MPGLGKGYDNSSDRPAKSNIRTASSKTPQSGSTSKGRPSPSLRTAPVQVKNNLGKTPFSGQPVSKRSKQPFRKALSAAAREEVFRRDHYECRICAASPLTDKAIKLEVDHIVPISRGGTNDPNNLQTLCQNCNRFKKASLV